MCMECYLVENKGFFGYMATYISDKAKKSKNVYTNLLKAIIIFPYWVGVVGLLGFARGV